MKIKRYTAIDKDQWDTFVSASKNGTFLLYRNFIEYHKDRFIDHSLLFYEKDKLVALLPANERDGVCYSHQGLTYGGLIMNVDTTATQILAVAEGLLNYLREREFKTIIYKAIPHIYHRIPSEEDLYALFRFDAQLIQRNLSSTIILPNRVDYSRSRLRGIAKTRKKNWTVIQSEDFATFWTILTNNLENRHNTQPVHTVEEIIYLKSKFEKQIQLYAVLDENAVMQAGCLTFEMPNIIHAQYTAATTAGREHGAIDAVIDCIIQKAPTDVRYFDYGISTENEGTLLNENLIYQKEGFGARGIVYDIYKIDL